MRGRLLASAQHSYPLQHPADGRVELDPERVWRAAAGVLTQLAASARIRAIAVAASVDDVLFVDERGQPLGAAIMALDTRSNGQAETLFDRLPASRVHQLTGLPPAAIHPLVRLAWLRDNDPARFERVKLVLGWGEWILSRLGLPPLSEPSQAARSMAWEIDTARWSPEMLSAAGLPAEVFPRVAASGSVAGRVAPNLAHALGLPADVAVVLGGADQSVATLGCGCALPGQAMLGLGSWLALSVLAANRPTGDELAAGGYSVGPYVLPPLMALMATSTGGTATLGWWATTLGEADLASALRRLPQRPTALLGVAHASGAYSPWLDPTSRAAVTGFGLETTRGELTKALLEASAFELRLNAERLRAAGAGFDELRATGGGSRSAAWLQLTADILELPVLRFSHADTGVVGAAAIAAAGVGAISSPLDLVRRVVHVRRAFEPRPEYAAAYAQRYMHWLGLYPALASSRIRRS